MSAAVSTPREKPILFSAPMDAKAEGCAAWPVTARDEYESLWDSINSKRAPWSSNPWVWVVSFRRIS